MPTNGARSVAIVRRSENGAIATIAVTRVDGSCMSTTIHTTTSTPAPAPATRQRRLAHVMMSWSWQLQNDRFVRAEPTFATGAQPRTRPRPGQPTGHVRLALVLLERTPKLGVAR